MSTRKIKIKDNDELRTMIAKLYATGDQRTVAAWSLSCARHLITVTSHSLSEHIEISDGFRVNELWQKGQMRVSDVRNAALKIHRYARTLDNELEKTIFRTVGHAVASGHMKEHAMVASDYAIKAINISYIGDMAKVDEERKWQLTEIKSLIASSMHGYEKSEGE